MKAVLLTLSFALLLLILIPFTLSLGIKFLPSGPQPSMGATKKIYSGINISQTFKSPENNLAGVGTSIKNPNFANTEDLKVEIYDENNQLIRALSINGRNTGDGNFMKLNFSPIPDSKDKVYTFSLSSESSTFEKSMEVFLTQDHPSWNVQLKENDEIVKENISFITLHKVSSPFEVGSLILTNLFNRFLADTYFFIFYLLIIVSIIIALIIPSKKKD